MIFLREETIAFRVLMALKKEKRIYCLIQAVKDTVISNFLSIYPNMEMAGKIS